MNIPVDKILSLIQDPDLKLKISALYGENLDLKQKNYALKKKLSKLQETISVGSKLKHEDNHYYLVEGEGKDGPYCTKCWDADSKLVRIHKGNFANGEQHFTCPNCQTHTYTGKYIQPGNVGGVDW